MMSDSLLEQAIRAVGVNPTTDRSVIDGNPAVWVSVIKLYDRELSSLKEQNDALQTSIVDNRRELKEVLENRDHLIGCGLTPEDSEIRRLDSRIRALAVSIKLGETSNSLNLSGEIKYYTEQRAVAASRLKRIETLAALSKKRGVKL